MRLILEEDDERFNDFLDLIMKYENKIDECENTRLRKIYTEFVRDLKNVEFKTIYELVKTC